MGNDVCREIVSAIPNKKRYQECGHNLDLACFKEQRLVVMAWPADDQIFIKDMKRSKLIRNDAQQVRKCLAEIYPAGFKVYNLCSEHKSFQKLSDVDVVHNYGWADHEPPPFDVLKNLLDDMSAYLRENEDRGIAIHCKAGKGRTGTAASSFLLRNCPTICHDSVQAMGLFGEKRFGHADAVKIESQRRYVKYYEDFINNGMHYLPVFIVLTRIEILFTSKLNAKKELDYQNEQYRLEVKQYSSDCDENVRELTKVFEEKELRANYEKESGGLIIQLDSFPQLKGDIKFKITKEPNIFSKEKTVSVFWINTAFERGPEVVVHSKNFDLKRENCVPKVDRVVFHVQVQ